MLSLLLACTSSPPALPAGGAVPDLVLVSIDTLRADHLGAYGYGRPTTPFLDGLAARGTRFAHARAPSPWTLPSHATMLTGGLPQRHGLVEDDQSLGASWTTLAQVLDAAGYRTGAFVTSFFVGRTYDLDRGFERFEDFGITSKKRNLQATVDAEQVVDEALGYLAEAPGRSHFLFLHLYDVHYPYAAPAPWNERFDRRQRSGDLTYKTWFHYLDHPVDDDQLAHQVAQYDEELAYVDDQLRRLSEAFQAVGRPVVLVVTADHGEEFGERGSWGHAHTLFAEQLRVPLIFAGPGVGAGVVQQAVGLQDLAPTLAELAGTVLAGDGVSLVEALGGAEPAARVFVGDTSRFKTNRLGLWQEGLRVDWNAQDEVWGLYGDPDEPEDLASARPEDLQRLRSALGAALPTPWEAAPGRLRTSGVLVVDGTPRGTELVLETPTPFAVVPVDAKVWHEYAGPWTLGRQPEDGAAVRYRGGGTGEALLSAEDRARLEALGYIQE